MLCVNNNSGKLGANTGTPFEAELCCKLVTVYTPQTHTHCQACFAALSQWKGGSVCECGVKTVRVFMLVFVRKASVWYVCLQDRMSQRCVRCLSCELLLATGVCIYYMLILFLCALRIWIIHSFLSAVHQKEST